MKTLIQLSAKDLEPLNLETSLIPIQENSIKIHVTYNIDKKLYHKIDKNFLEKILTNLLTNAIKYAPENSQIEIGVNHENDQLLIRVKDFGAGVKEEDRKKSRERINLYPGYFEE